MQRSNNLSSYDCPWLTSFFVTNFPRKWESKYLWVEFMKYGRLEYFYIVGKNDKHGYRFGFARYRKVEKEEEVVKCLNQMNTGACKIFAKLASFDRKKEIVEDKIGVKKGARRTPGFREDEGKTIPNVSFANTVKGDLKLVEDKPVSQSYMSFSSEECKLLKKEL